MTKIKRVLILTTPFRPNVGGVETHLDDLIFEAAKLGLKFDVLTYQPLITKASGQTIEKNDDYTVYRIPWLRFNLFLKLEKYPLMEFIYLFPALFIGGVLYFLLKKDNVNIIHAQGLIAGAVGVFMGIIFKKDVIISTHSIYHFPKQGLYRNFIKFLCNHSKQVLTLSNQSRREVLELGIKPTQVSTFTYWVNQEIFKPSSKILARKRLKLPRQKFLVLFVGRLVEVKGINELLEAATQLPTIRFMVVGDGPLASKVQEFSQSYPNITFLGKVDNQNLPLYYSGADVLIVPSTHEEGFGRVILEALSCGLPVIGADRGGIKEILTPEIGLLIKISPANIKNNLKMVLKNRRQLVKMRQNTINYAKKMFSSQNVLEITKFYE